MFKTLRAATALVTVIYAFGFGTPALAEMYHHSKAHHVHGINAVSHKVASKAVHHSAKHHHHVSAGSSSLREAQSHLQHLGYYTGKVDGVNGSKTRVAVKKFQLHNGLKVDGVVGSATLSKLRQMDRVAFNDVPPAVAIPTKNDFYTEHPDFYGHYDQNYADPMLLGEPVIPSRYGRLEMHEKAEPQQTKSYDLILNGQAMVFADRQPSVIGVSRTFSLDNEDVVIVTAFRPDDNICSYKHFLLALNMEGYKLHEITNCTREFKATAEYNSVFIVFPEDDDARVVGSTWRYESGSLQKL